MTREKALEAMDRLVAMGYTVSLTERDMGAHGMVYVDPDGGRTSIHRSLSITELSMDKVDLRALVKAADELGLDVGMNAIGQGALVFDDMPTEAERRRQAVAGHPRKHPRDDGDQGWG